MLEERDLVRLSRYFADEVTADEREEVERWIAAVPARAELVDRLRRGWERSVAPSAPFDTERAWAEVVRRKAVRGVSEGEAVRAIVGRRPARPLVLLAGASRRRWWPMAAAASVAIAVVSGVMWQANVVRRAVPVANVGALRTITTPRGQAADVYLSDGTHVRLAAASTLRFPSTFHGARHVYLEGEGYFDVVHDPSREFAVHTGRAVVRDIGTRFNVRAYRNDVIEEVVVTEGVVALKSMRAATDSVILERFDLGRVRADGAMSATRDVDVAVYLAWMHRQLVFVDTPLRDALPQLNRWYDVDISVVDSALAAATLTATFSADSLPATLRRLEAVLDARVERRARTIVFTPNRRAQHSQANRDAPTSPRSPLSR